MSRAFERQLVFQNGADAAKFCAAIGNIGTTPKDATLQRVQQVVVTTLPERNLRAMSQLSGVQPISMSTTRPGDDAPTIRCGETQNVWLEVTQGDVDRLGDTIQELADQARCSLQEAIEPGDLVRLQLTIVPKGQKL